MARVPDGDEAGQDHEDREFSDELEALEARHPSAL
jgi:hypothetical protein